MMEVHVCRCCGVGFESNGGVCLLKSVKIEGRGFRAVFLWTTEQLWLSA